MRRIAVLLVALALGCGFDSSSGPFIIGGGGTAGTRIRFFHAVADGGNLQLLNDGLTNLSQIGFASVTPYIQTGGQSVHLTLNSTLATTPVFDSIVTLPDSSLLTIVAEGTDSTITLKFLVDGRASPDTGLVKLRVLDESPTGSPLDVYLTAPLADLNTATPLVAGFSFGAATAYSVLTSGTYQVRFTLTGTKTVVIDTGSLVLSNGDVRSVMVLDAAGGGLPLQAIVLQDAGT